MNYNGYVYRNSFIHRLNPSVKFLISIIFIVLIFIPYGFFIQLILLVVLLVLYFLAKLPFKKFINIIISILVMMAILMVVNWLTYKTPGVVFDMQDRATFLISDSTLLIANDNHFIKTEDNRIFLHGYMWGSSILEWNHLQTILITNGIGVAENINMSNSGFYNLSSLNAEQYQLITKLLKEEGYTVMQHGVVASDMIVYIFKSSWYSLSSFAILLMFSVSLKIFLMILIVTILTATTSSVELTYALEDILNPLRIFRLPVSVWSTTIALGIRFIPSLLDESERIMKAQASRGLDFKNGNIIDKLYSLTSFIVPLFSIAFKKADELANAMEARGYNPRYTRTRYRDYKIRVWDWLIFMLLAISLGIIIALTTVIGDGKIAYISPLGILEATSMFGV